MTSAPFKRPRRRRVTDRLIGGDATREEAMCDHAVAPFDRMARDMDRKWGVDRLPELVPPDLAARYGAALHALNEALVASDVDKVATLAANAARGLEKLDQVATAAGAQPADTRVLIGSCADWKFGVLVDEAAWPQVQEKYPEMTLFSISEVGHALKHWKLDSPVVKSAKEAFPGARITAIRPKHNLIIDDEIPF